MTTPFYKCRLSYQPRFPELFKTISKISINAQADAISREQHKDREALKKLFPITHGQPVLNLHADAKAATAASTKTAGLVVGVVLSGGQAPGGHNVICGIFDGLKQLSEKNTLLGFAAGPNGIVTNKTVPVTKELVDRYRNTGGFDMLGSGRTKLETEEQFIKCRQVLESHKCDALVIIGGDDSNTNAALLAEYLKAQGSSISIIGVPKTIDGDLKNEYVETSFGFDTAVRLYSELISNLATDALSSKKYYHFIRLMGRAASHITVEAALLTHPNIVLISEEVGAAKKSLYDVVEDMVRVIVARAEQGKNFGIVLVPEGLIEFIPEIRTLIEELNDVMAKHREYMQTLKGFTDQSEYLNHKLSKEASYTLSGLPIDIQRQLLMERDPHGNVKLSMIETEKLLIELLVRRLAELRAEGKFKGKFAWQSHFLGYEGRCAAPTNFDSDYAYALGLTAVALAKSKVSGYMTVVKNLAEPHDQWQAMGVPLTLMMNLEQRGAGLKPVIEKGLVSLESKAFQKIREYRETWAMTDDYRFSGAIQYFGPPEITDLVPKTLVLESKGNPANNKKTC